MNNEKNLVLNCSATNFDDLLIPEFKIFRGSTCGISVPTNIGPSWSSLMKALSGQAKNSNVYVSHRGLALSPQMGFGQLDADDNVIKLLEKSNTDMETYELFGMQNRINSTTRIKNLPLTSHFLIEILCLTDIDFIVLCTAGLDALGVEKICTAISKFEITSLHVFSASLVSFYDEINVFDEIITCKALPLP